MRPNAPRFAGLEPQDQETSLVELLDRLLDKGVVIRGDLIITVADIELVWVGIKVVLGSVDTIADLHPMRARLKAEREAAQAELFHKEVHHDP